MNDFIPIPADYKAPEKKKVHKPAYKGMYEMALADKEKTFYTLIKAIIVASIGWIGFISTVLILIFK